jgi:hypothetical protein
MVEMKYHIMTVKLIIVLLLGLLCLVLLLGLDAPNTVEGATGSFKVDDTPPGTVTDLQVSSSGVRWLELRWTAPGNDGNIGTAKNYDVRYSPSPILTEIEWNAAIKVTNEPSPKPAGSTQTFRVGGLRENTMYWFALKTTDGAYWSDLSNIVAGETTLESDSWSGGPGYQVRTMQIDLWGHFIYVQTTMGGVLLEKVEAVSPAGELTLLIRKGTSISDSEGDPVDIIEVRLITVPGPMPDMAIIWTGYKIQPRCNFDPPITLTLRYEPQMLVNKTTEGDLVIVYYDSVQKTWLEMPTEVDVRTYTVSTMLTHSGMFAILGEVSDLVTIPDTKPEIPAPATPGPVIVPPPVPLPTVSSPPPPAQSAPTFNLTPGVWGGIGLSITVLIGFIIWFILKRRIHL